MGTVDSRKEATALEEDHRVKQRMRASGELAAEHDTKRTLQEAAESWLRWLAESHSRSHRAYSEFMKYQILPHLGAASIATLTSKHVARWRDDVAKDYAATTVNSALGCLSSAFSWFVAERWLAANPCDGVKQREVPDRAYKWIRTRGELERLLLASSEELRDMIAVSVATMLRIDEMLHLQHDDIDLDARLITVQRGRQGTTKSGKVRHVPILDSALDVLRRRRWKRGASPLLFPGKGGRVRAQSPVTCAFKGVLRRAQLDESLVWHALRHTGASWWVMSGGDIFRLSKLMGHADVKITQKTYAHLAPEAWHQDYHRLAFHVPTEPARVVEIVRDGRGRLAGRRSITVDARETADPGARKSA